MFWADNSLHFYVEHSVNVIEIYWHNSKLRYIQRNALNYSI